MKTCAICGGSVRKGKTTVTVDRGVGVIVVRGVSAHICSCCGEEWLDHKSAERVEQVVAKAGKDNAQVEIVALAQ